jgi:cell wall-associated NlpC family hydrolase
MNAFPRRIRKSMIGSLHGLKIRSRVATVVVATVAASVVAVGLTVSSAEAATCKGVTREKAMCIAMQQRGDPYVWGAEGPGSFDCSGLMQYAYKKAGLKIARVSQDQAKMGSKAKSKWFRVKKPLPGDLVFFSPEGKNSHVGMYIGGGKIVHAPRPGTNVRTATVKSQGKVTSYLHYGG